MKKVALTVVVASYDGNACSFRFYSYRDPRLAETFKDFEASIVWLLNTEHQPHQLEEAILGLIASMDKLRFSCG